VRARVGDDGILLDTITESDPDLYRSSVRRLCELPVHVVRPAHGPSFGPRRARAELRSAAGTGRASVRGGHGPSFGPRRLHSIIDRYLEERS
jgi:hypothetical protein